MTEEQISNCKEILKKFIYKVRNGLENGGGVSELIFHYYTDSEIDEFKTYPINTPEFFASFNFERTKRQIRKRILTVRNEYWNLDETKAKFLESFCISHSKKFDTLFKEYINYLWKCNFKALREESKRKEKEDKEKDDKNLKIILGNKYDFYKEVVNLILNDTQEYPYKSDKIKVLLEIELDVETIFMLLQTKEKWISPRGYINKYAEERKEGIKQRKIVVYELNSTIKHIMAQLRGYSQNI